MPGRSCLAVAAWSVFLAMAFWAGPAVAQDEVVVKGGRAIYPLLEVSIADGDRLARLYIGFEAQCQDENGAVQAASPQAREAVLLFLRSKTAAQLSGELAKRRLKDEIISVMNKAIGAPRVVRLYYLQFVIR
ncbi:flagellar basal body-associated FliL family protein [Solidesulfovibrio sp.]|uniref:flagellar basal body-associated FliL family protein n=1 Tax=Solidesulfovibrio sp. TaxID=2910990 RepID=UPI0026310827|nr:flagellar basal body-associated FliL family protein [Solidesulfovibrio sp.]